MPSKKTRTEKDALGKVRIAKDAPRGSYTHRVLQTYPQQDAPRVPELFLRSYIETKMIYATVNARFRKLTSQEKSAIHQAGKFLLKQKSEIFMSYFPISQLQSGGGTCTNMMVNEVLANKANVLLGGSYGNGPISSHNHVNASQSSNDTFPGVTKITLWKLLPECIAALRTLEKTCKQLARKGKTIKKVGRTHLQDAVVIRLGDEFDAYARTIQKNISYMQQAWKVIHELNFGGTATGSLQNITPAMRKELIRAFGIFYKTSFTQPKSYFEQNSSSGDIAFVSQMMAHLANDLIKIGNDMRLLSSGPLAGIEEYILPAVHPGSSIMPGKVNPSVVEAMTMVAARMLGVDQTVQLLTRQAQLQLQQFMPGITFPLIEAIQAMTSMITVFEESCVRDIVFNKQHITELLDGSFAYATDYSETLGYEVVAEAVVEALKSGKTLQQILDAR